MRQTGSQATPESFSASEALGEAWWRIWATLAAVVALAMSVRYMIGALLWLNGWIGSPIVGGVIGVAGLIFIVFHYSRLIRYARESRELRRAGHPRRPYPVLASIVGLAVLYLVIACSVVTSVEGITVPTAGQRADLVQKIFATPPWNGSLL